MDVFGIFNESDVFYAFWSGFGSVIIPGILAYLVFRWKVQCHRPGCYRQGLFDLHDDKGIWKVCKKHHPHDEPGAHL